MLIMAVLALASVRCSTWLERVIVRVKYNLKKNYYLWLVSDRIVAAVLVGCLTLPDYINKKVDAFI